MAVGFVRPLQRVVDPGSVPVRPAPAPKQRIQSTNTRSSLWPERWPAIALPECIEKVEAAPPELQADVKRELPCQTCEAKAGCLNAKRKEIGPLMYDRELLTTPRASGSSLFPMELFNPCLRPEESLVPYWHKPLSLESRYRIVQAWDIAWSEKIGGDWLVCMTALLDLEDGQRRLLDINRWRQVSFDDQMKLIEATWQQFAADLVVIESDAAQQVWTKHLGRTSSVPVLQHEAGDKQSLARGVPSLLISLSNRKWVFPTEPGSYHQEHLEAFFHEAEAFGWTDGHLEGVGEHDDTVMCWWHLSWAMDRLAVFS